MQFEAAPLQNLFDKQKAYFATDVTKTYEWRVDQLDRLIREGSTRISVPSTHAARESFRNALQEVRNQNLLIGKSLEAVRSYLLLAHRLDVIADDLETCRDQTLSLALERYRDDYSL